MQINQQDGLNKLPRLLAKLFYKPGFFKGSSTVPLIPLLVGGCLAIAYQTSIKAEAVSEFLLAQSVIDGLPPPPNVPQVEFPAQPPVIDNREYNFQAPPSTTQRNSSSIYRVLVSGDSSLLLQQVRYVEPQAFVRPGEGVIQAGLFIDQSNAQELVQQLQGQGIQAQITTIGTRGSSSSQAVARPSYYFVAIPSDRSNLPNVAAKIVQLGLSPQAVRIRNNPLGPHVAVGPFEERSQAERWNSYLRSYKLDSRVYFGR